MYGVSRRKAKWSHVFLIIAGLMALLRWTLLNYHLDEWKRHAKRKCWQVSPEMASGDIWPLSSYQGIVRYGLMARMVFNWRNTTVRNESWRSSLFLYWYWDLNSAVREGDLFQPSKPRHPGLESWNKNQSTNNLTAIEVYSVQDWKGGIMISLVLIALPEGICLLCLYEPLEFRMLLCQNHTLRITSNERRGKVVMKEVNLNYSIKKFVY